MADQRCPCLLMATLPQRDGKRIWLHSVMIKTVAGMRSYVEKTGGTYGIAGTRVSLDSVVYAFRDGLSPESIRESYPVLSLEEVQGAITFYLARQNEIDDYLAEGEKRSDELWRESQDLNSELIARLRQTRRETSVPR